MRRNALFFAVLVAMATAIAASPQSSNCPNCDDLGTALANHGMDPGTAPIAAAALEVGIGNTQQLLARLTTDEQQIANLQAQLGEFEPLPAIVVEPANQTVSLGGTVSFTAKTNVECRSQVHAGGATSFGPAGVTVFTYTIANVTSAMNGEAVSFSFFACGTPTSLGSFSIPDSSKAVLTVQ